MGRLFRLFLCCTYAVAAVPATTAGGEPVSVHLAVENKALMQIVVAPSASKLVRGAAEDLATYLGRISGARFELAEGDGSSGVAVGVYTDFPALQTGVAFDPTKPSRREKYLLRTHANGAWLIGASERAAEHAVWDFLHRLGYRLFFLTDTWEVVPKKQDLRLAVDVVEGPDFITRAAPRGAPWSNGKLWNRWRTRNRVFSDFVLHTGHAYDGIISANEEAFTAHPEYRALIGDERRGSKFCISNPGLRGLVVEHAVRAMRANPDRDSISMDPSDGGGWCQCERCAEMGSVSDRVVILANAVAKAINGLGLGQKFVGIYGYNQHSPPPDIEVHSNVVVSVATSFIRGGYTLEQLVEGWSARGASLGIRDYHDVFTWSHDMPRRARGGNIGYLTERIPWYYENGARFMNSENADSWGANGLGYWLTPLMLWDVSAAARVDDYIEDFLEKAFGVAREPMRNFYHLLNQDRSLRTPSDMVGRMYRSLAAARKLASTPHVHARLDDLVLYTRYCELYHRYRAASGEARQQAFEKVWRHTHRIRNRMMLSTRAICEREKFRDKSVVVYSDKVWRPPETMPVTSPDEMIGGQGATDGTDTTLEALIAETEVDLGLAEPVQEGHPWESDEPYTEKELAAMVSAGIENNPILILDFEPMAFSDDLVPATPLALPDVEQGNFPLRGRGSRKFLTWFDEPGPIELKVTGGLIAHYRDRGNVKISLYSPMEVTLEPVAHDESVPPDGNSYTVTLRTPYEGLHRLEVADGSDKTEFIPPDGLPVTIASSWEDRPGRTLRGTWTLYFYVPRGTAVIGGFAKDLSGTLHDGDGNPAFSFSELGRPGYFNVPVPEGHDGRLWKIADSSGEKLLMTVPPYLARSGQELLLPREVVDADVVR